MSYTLYTDKNENFSAEVSVKNASLKNSIARLIVESDNLNLVFKGHIEDGKCIIPIKKLKGVLDENTKGKIHLEIIIEDVYFKPWESDFVVEEHTSMKVVVQEQKQPSSKPMVEVKVEQIKPVIVEQAQPIVEPVKQTAQPEILTTPILATVHQKTEVKTPKKKSTSAVYPSDELVSICESIGVTKKDLTKETLHNLLKEYFTANTEFIDNRSAIAKQFLKKIK
jgi:hypothetical protein